MTDRHTLFHRFRKQFMGLDRMDPVYTHHGERGSKRRIYLDTTATALMPDVVWKGLTDYLQSASANSHTLAHRAGRDTTGAIEDSRDAVGRLVGYDADRDVVLFTGNGATGSINFLARALFPPELRPLIKRFPDGPPPALVDAYRDAYGPEGSGVIDELLARPLVVMSTMEHHSNLLPWMEAVGHANSLAVDVDPCTGALDLAHLERILAANGDRIRLVAICGVSNVTGIVNPVHDVARMAHRVGAQLLVDGAQWVPHAPVRMHGKDEEASIDYLVLSGHKLYAPGSRGALIGPLSTLSGKRCVADVGGGMVDYVSLADYEIKEAVTAREEAGTPNIPGTISMGLIAETLLQIGMDVVSIEEHALTEHLLGRLSQLEGVTVYGSTDLGQVPRAGVVSFNVEGLYHAITAQYLNDFHNIAVRNECFCAHPYVKLLLGIDDDTERRYRSKIHQNDRRRIPGMVRASLGIYSTGEDVDALAEALTEIVARRDEILALYRVALDGSCCRKDTQTLPVTFSVVDHVAAWVGGNG